MKFAVVIFLVINVTLIHELFAAAPCFLNCPGNEVALSSGYDCQTCCLQTVKCAEIKECRCYCDNNAGYARVDGSRECIPRSECSKISCPSHP
ncbi:hypothetical protein Zmor_011455 [Zophobas morio]|uniref:TIL domain-containing protein n=1 Tax=Zophobas morio TaxID=2755281 RepID=A0AA38MKV6_9CUCU|nr:hypothetical protein Zmor_011455 [Zophobas morio]